MNSIEIFEKWKALGFLEGLDIIKQIDLSQAMEYASDILINDSKKNYRRYNYDVDVITFPILRKLIHKHSLTKTFVVNLLEKIKKLTESSFYNDIKNIHAEPPMDIEVEIINFFIEINYGK